MLMQIKSMECVFQANTEIPMSIQTSPRKPLYKICMLAICHKLNLFLNMVI